MGKCKWFLVLKPFGCRITGVKRIPAPLPDYFSGGDRILTIDRLEEALKETDHLVMVLPGGTGTDGIFRREFFKALPEHCCIYNVGRGNLYQESDLVEALREGEIADAYLEISHPSQRGAPGLTRSREFDMTMFPSVRDCIKLDWDGPQYDE